MRKNDVENLVVENYGCNGEGVAKADGKVVFIPYTIKGERVETLIIGDKKSYYVGKAKSILESSDLRVEPKCPYFTKCGGCQLQHIKYDETLSIKTEMVQNALDRIGKIGKGVQFCKPSNLVYGYRNKLALPFDYGTRKVGIYAPHSHRIIQIDDCPIQQNWCKKLIEITNEFVNKFQLTIYNEETKTGLLKHLVARAYNNALLVTLVINGDELPNYEDYFAYLLSDFENVGLSININKLNNNVILTENFVHLCGLEKIDICENGIKYSINNASFMQVNNYIKNEIYAQILEEINNYDVVVDAYSGAGLLTAMISKKAKRVYGVEIVKEAVNSSNELLKENNILNVTNICGDSSKEVNNLSKEISLTNSCIVLDPPRKGCDKELLEKLCEVEPAKIIYLSCNPSTLARDLNILSSKFSVDYAKPFDMFPQTKHVETLVCLKKK